MTIASRTPEGDPNVCPVCGHDLRLEPSIDTRDGPCPACGHLLWFDGGGGRPGRRPAASCDHAQLADAVLRVGQERLGRPPLAVRDAAYGIDDADRLEELLERALDASSWEELFAEVR